MPLPTLQELRRNYILGLLNDSVFTKFKDDPAVQTLASEIQAGYVQRVDLTADPKAIAQLLFNAQQKGYLRDSDVVKLAMNEPPESPLKGAANMAINMIEKQQIQKARTPPVPVATPPAGGGSTPPGGAKATPPEGKKPNIKIEKQFDKLRAQMVVELDKATIDNLVKSYARGQSVAIWESSQGKEKIELGGPDPDEQVKYLIKALQPVHEYNTKLAGILTTRVTDQIKSGTEPGVISKGMEETITHFLKQPVEVPLKGPDGKPKLDKDGNQMVRVYSPESYANLLARTTTYSLRNRGYIDHYKTMGIYDGWESVCSADERSCTPCLDKDGKLYAWDNPQEPPAYHPFCRCRVKAHLKKDAEEGFQGPDDGKEELPPVTVAVPSGQEQKVQAWHDWTVDMDYNSIKGTVEADLGTQIKEEEYHDIGQDYGAAFKEDKEGNQVPKIWVSKDLPELSKSHAAVGAYGQLVSTSTKMYGDPAKFLGCSDEVWVAMRPQSDLLFKEVNVARITNARVNLEALKQETEENWQKVVQKGKWLPKDVPLSRIASSSQSGFTEAEIWHNLKKTHGDFYDMLNTQIRSESFLSNTIIMPDGQKKKVPLNQWKETMLEWRKGQHGAEIPDELFQDALDMTLRSWYRRGDAEAWANLTHRISTGAHQGAMLEGLHIDPGMVKEIAPDIYDHLVKQVTTGAYGEPIKKILTFTGDLTKNLPQEVKVFKDWDEIRNLIQQETGFTIKFNTESSASRLPGQLAGIDRKAKQIWLDRSLRTNEASQLLVGQHSRLWAEDQAKAMKLKGPEGPIRAFFNWKEGGSQDELNKMLCQMNISAQHEGPFNFEQMADNIEKDWGSVWKRHGSKWGLTDKASEEEVSTAIEDYLLKLKEKGVDLTWAENPANTKFSLTRKILGQEQEVNLDNYQYWFKRDLEQQMGKLKGAEKTDVTNKWGDIYQYLKTQWWRQAQETSFSGSAAMVDPGEKVAAFVTTLYRDEKAVKEMAPKCYDRFVALNQQQYYGRVLGKVFDTSAATPLQDITGKMNFVLEPMGNYDDMVREVKKVFPFKHKKLSSAYGHFVPNRSGNIQGTEVAISSSLKGSPHARTTLVHETGHGIDWMNSGTRHDCARSISDLRENCFPNLSLQETQTIVDSELKDVMCQVRHSVAMDDVRLADSLADAQLLEDRASPEALKRLKKAPAQVDYLKARGDLLNEIESSIKTKDYSLQAYQGNGIGPVKPVIKKVQTLEEYKTAMDSYAQKYANAIMESAMKKGSQGTDAIEKAAHAKVAFLNDFLTVASKDSTTLYKSNFDVPVTIYNFEEWAEQYFTALPIDTGLKKDIVNSVKLSWMQRCEGHCWSSDYAWSQKPTERWAVFVQSMYIDPKRTAEIAPKAYKAFMENMRSNKYASVLGKLLGYRAVI